MDSYCRDLIMSRLLDSGRDIRFSIKAYEFVFLIFGMLEKNNRNTDDFSAEEIVQMSVKTANILYGPIAEFVLADMGIKSANDIGDVIFNLIDLKLFSKSEIDSRFEFSGLSKKMLFSGARSKPLNLEKLKIFEDT